ncbi:MAG: hypothetical protein KOO65_08625 [Desulfobacterales bacterium]|nr:hypothetical protein [Desulfobacterales bacterium]
MGLKLLLKYPTRSRPELFKSTITKYLEFMTNKDDYEFVVSADRGDDSMNNDNIIEFVKSLKNCSIKFGNSKTKIEACNSDVPDTPWDIVVLVSDDQIPQIKGYDDIIRNDMEKYFPDLDGLLWYFDNRQRNICTLTIMGRRMYDGMTHLYHPDFTTHCCDNFLTIVTEGKQKFIDKCIIKHEWRLHNSDDLMEANEDSFKTSMDRRKFRRLRRKWLKTKDYTEFRS